MSTAIPGEQAIPQKPTVRLSLPIRRVSWLLICTLACLPLGAFASLEQEVGTFRAADAPSIGGVALFSGRLLGEFYEQRDYANAWDEDRARAFLELARESRADGFEPADFHADAIAARLAAGDLATDAGSGRTATDILLSDALLRYIHHFRFGKHNPRHINPGWIFVEKADAEALKADMAAVLGAADLASALRAMLPSPDFYTNLKRGYQRYLAMADAGDWQEIPGGVNLTVGMSDPRVALIRTRLALTDELDDDPAAEPERYDATLAQAVRDFQGRSGLMQDGVVGPNTLRALNFPVDERLRTIRGNLERMRWLYNALPDDYLLVDLTAFRLHLYRGGEEVWDTRVVIGTREDQTPMFRDEMEYMVFNPTWTVPPSIEKKFKGVPKGYKRERRGGRYYLVQQPGPRNALGRVKFMFPNGHAIYLHDTPSRHLFSRSERAYSHGCVRVKDPLTLAEKVLNKPNWDQSQIKRVVNRGKSRWVHLDEHLPVLLYYLTAVADEHGRVGFRRDLYDRDRRLLAALDKPADLDRIAFREPEPEPEAAPDADQEQVGERTAGEPRQRPQSTPAAVTADGGDELGAAAPAGAQAPATDGAAPLAAPPAAQQAARTAPAEERMPASPGALRAEAQTVPVPDSPQAEAIREGAAGPDEQPQQPGPSLPDAGTPALHLDGAGRFVEIDRVQR